MNHPFARHASHYLHDAGSLGIWLVALVVVFVPLEHFWALHPSKAWRRQSGVDLGWYFVNSLLSATLISTPLALLTAALLQANPGGFYTTMALLPLWPKLVLMLIANDIGAYWGHRALHAHPWLWRFHAIHHSAEHMDWLVNTRAHPFDIVFMRLAGYAPLCLLGLVQTTRGQIDPALAAVAIFLTLWNFLIHANIRLRLGPLQWVISSPLFHHWHHTNDERRDRNFAFIFPLIDKLFGTAWLPKEWPSAYGIDEPVPPTLSGQFIEPIWPSHGPPAAEEK